MFYGRWRFSDEYSGDGNGSRAGSAGDHLPVQQLLPWHGASDAAVILWKRYEATCLRRRRTCPANCKGPNASCPPYTPDFIALAKSYGAHGIRVEKEEDIQAALDEARTYTDAPTIIEFMISTDEIVLPMVKSGNPMSEMILK